MVPMVRGNQGM